MRTIVHVDYGDEKCRETIVEEDESWVVCNLGR